MQNHLCQFLLIKLSKIIETKLFFAKKLFLKPLLTEIYDLKIVAYISAPLLAINVANNIVLLFVKRDIFSWKTNALNVEVLGNLD